MRRSNVLNIILELVVVLGYIVLGVTCLTYIIQRANADRYFVGSIVGALGIIQFASFFTLKFAVKLKSIQSAVAALFLVALGIVFVVVNMEPTTVCIVLGIANIVINVVSIVTSSINLTRQPLLNSARIIIDIVSIVFSIFLIVKTTSVFYTFITFVGIALLAEALVLFIEFIIHRYQS